MSKDSNERGSMIPAILDSVTKFGLDALGAGSIKSFYELYSTVTKSFADYRAERDEERGREFHRALFANGAPLISNALDAKDYEALLSACLDDLEKEKIKIYGQLARSIALNAVDERYKQYLILTLKVLTFSQFEKMRKAWIASNYRLADKTSGSSISPHIYLGGESENIMDEVDLEVLESKKLVKDSELTLLGNSLIESCCLSVKLIPEDIGEESWIGGALDILTVEQDDGVVNRFCESLLPLMFAGLIKANFFTPATEGLVSRHIERVAVVVLLVKDPKVLIEQLDDVLRIISKRKVILVCLGSPDKHLINYFSDVEVLKLNSLEIADVTRLLNKVNSVARRNFKSRVDGIRSKLRMP